MLWVNKAVGEIKEGRKGLLPVCQMETSNSGLPECAQVHKEGAQRTAPTDPPTLSTTQASPPPG